MNKYSNGKIYKIVSNQTDDIYIGSTCQKLCQRMCNHRCNFKLWKNGKYYFVTSFELIKHDDCKIILIEDYQCDNKEQLNQRERFYVENMDCVNKCIPGRTRKEYGKEHYQNNRELLCEKAKIYRESHKYKIRENNKEKHNCECGGKYTTCNKSRHLKSKKHINYLENNM